MSAVHHSAGSGRGAAPCALDTIFTAGAFPGTDALCGARRVNDSFEKLLLGRKTEMGPKGGLVPPLGGLQTVAETYPPESRGHPAAQLSRPQKSSARSISGNSQGESRRKPEGNEIEARRKSRFPSGNRDEGATSTADNVPDSLSRSLKAVAPSGDLGCDEKYVWGPGEEERVAADLAEYSPAGRLAEGWPVQADFDALYVGCGPSLGAAIPAPNEAANLSEAGFVDDRSGQPASDATMPSGGGAGPACPSDARSAAISGGLPGGAGEALGGSGLELVPGFAPADGINANAAQLDSFGMASEAFSPRDELSAPAEGGQTGAHPGEALSENIAPQAMREAASLIYKDSQNSDGANFTDSDKGGGTLPADRGMQSMLFARTSFFGFAVDAPGADLSRRISAAHVVGELVAVRDGLASSGSDRCVVDFDVEGHGSLRVEIIRRADQLEAVVRTDSEFLRDSLRSAFGSAEGSRSQPAPSSAQKSEAGANGTDLGGRERGGNYRRQNPTAPQSGMPPLEVAASGRREPEAVAEGSGVSRRLLHTFA